MINTNNLIKESILLAGSLLKELTNNSDFDNKLKLAFGDNIETDLLKKTWIVGDFNFPEIEIVNSSEINYANGAYAKATNKIYLAQEFLLANINNLDAVTDVVLEEYGHYIDSQLNDVDTPGDEGAIFAALVRGEELNKSELQQLRNEDDSAVVVLEGESVAIEQNETGTTIRVNVASDGTQANGESSISWAEISADGTYIIFSSLADNLVENDTNGKEDVFVHNRQTGVTERVSVASDDSEGNAESDYYTPGSPISEDGRYIIFHSLADNLVENDTNNTRDIFVHDRQTGVTERVSVSSNGTQANEESHWGSISADGKYAIFFSYADNLVENDTNGMGDIFLRDIQTGITERVSVKSDGTQTNNNSFERKL